jgi:hypothetical protein
MKLFCRIEGGLLGERIIKECTGVAGELRD